MIDIMLMLSAVVVMFKVISVVASINIHAFDGHPMQFIGLALHWMLMGSGAVAVVLGVSAGGALLLAGVAIRVLSDRRAR